MCDKDRFNPKVVWSHLSVHFPHVKNKLLAGPPGSITHQSQPLSWMTSQAAAVLSVCDLFLLSHEPEHVWLLKAAFVYWWNWKSGPWSPRLGGCECTYLKAKWDWKQITEHALNSICTNKFFVFFFSWTDMSLSRFSKQHTLHFNCGILYKMCLSLEVNSAVYAVIAHVQY